MVVGGRCSGASTPHTAHQPRVYSTICPAELDVAVFNDMSRPLLAAQGPAVSSKVLTCPRPNLFFS